MNEIKPSTQQEIEATATGYSLGWRDGIDDVRTRLRAWAEAQKKKRVDYKRDGYRLALSELAAFLDEQGGGKHD